MNAPSNRALRIALLLTIMVGSVTLLYLVFDLVRFGMTDAPASAESVALLRNRYHIIAAVAVAGIIAIVTVLYNIRVAETDRRAEELSREVARRTEELTRAITTRDRFLSIISHDLRGPLGTIAQVLDFVDENREEFTKDNLFEIIEDLKISANSVWQLAENLLIWVRSRQERLVAVTETFPVKEAIEPILQTYYRMAAEKGVDLIWEGEGVLPIHCDRHFLATIVRNLVSNAIKFSAKGGSIRITVTPGDSAYPAGTTRSGHAAPPGAPDASGDPSTPERPGMTTITVRDTGIGIAPELLERLLAARSGVSTTGTGGETGTGLGFELVRDLVDRSDGTLEIASTEGEGTVVAVTMPAEA
ncbi:MAG: sensor histidine kinase [Alkalispirochaeta sp.]